MKKETPITKLVKALKEDNAYRKAWIDNIAMAYKDSHFLYMKRNNKRQASVKDRHIIANNAAEYFIKLLCDEYKYPKGR